jgi:hypothetical protein
MLPPMPTMRIGSRMPNRTVVMPLRSPMNAWRSIEISRAVEYKQRLISATDLSCRQAEVYVESLMVSTAEDTVGVAVIRAVAARPRSDRFLSA